MTSTSTEIETVSLEDHEFEIACEYDSRQPTAGVGSHDDPATWVLFKAHQCGSPIALSCDRCKVIRYDSIGVIRCTVCGEYEDNREFYFKAERINPG